MGLDGCLHKSAILQLFLGINVWSNVTLASFLLQYLFADTDLFFFWHHQVLASLAPYIVFDAFQMSDITYYLYLIAYLMSSAESFHWWLMDEK